MATIKSYTDLSQSKTLSKILPLESADMLWEQHGAEPYVTIKPWTTIGKSIGCHCLSCWSLAALLGVLPSATLDSSNDHYYRLHCMERFTEWYDNPVDACVAMIIKINELNLL